MIVYVILGDGIPVAVCRTMDMAGQVIGVLAKRAMVDGLTTVFRIVKTSEGAPS